MAVLTGIIWGWPTNSSVLLATRIEFANAIYNAVGARVRHMPITAEAILAGMKKKA